MSGVLKFRAALFACLACMASAIPLLAPPNAAAGPVAPQTYITQGPSSQHITTDRTPTFRFTSDQAGATFQCQIDDGPWFTCTSPYTTDPLSDGRHDFRVRAVNGLLTDQTPAHRAFFIDHDFVPETVITSGPAQGSTTADDTPTFEFAAASWNANWGYPQNHHETTFTCSIDGGPWFGCASPYTTPSLADGQHTFSVRATRDGRTDQSPATRTFIVDRGVPDTIITGGPTEGSVTSDPTPTFSFASTRANSTFTCIVDGAVTYACSSPTTLAALADGTHTFAVAATTGGMTDPTPALRTFVIDQPQPAVAGALPPLAPLGAAAAPPLPSSKVTIMSAAGRIGATGATRLMLRCSVGSGECVGNVRLVKTIRFRCGARFCYLRKTLATSSFVIATGSRRVVKPQLTTEALRLVRNARLNRLLVLAVATSEANTAQKVVLLLGRRPLIS